MNIRAFLPALIGTLAFLCLTNHLRAEDRVTGYAIYGPVTINTVIEAYSDYRIVPFNLVPNPSPLEIPEGGYGYAWFVVEGQYNGKWYPVMNVNLEAEDAQGNVISCQSRKLPYEFLNTVLRINDAGIFAVKIPASQVGTGIPGSSETVTVMRANSQTILPENRRSVLCEVVPYEYTASWGYRMYMYLGAGATAYALTGTAYAGGGTGSSIYLDLQGTGSDPDWPTMRVSRRGDVFLGQDLSVGPPKLLDIYEAGANEEASFPYETSFEFDVDDMTGLEALMAFYLFNEPVIKFSGGIGSVTTTFLDWIVDILIANDADSELAVKRYADEAGLDLKGSLELSCNVLEDLPLGMDLGAGLGVEAHTGASMKIYTDGKVQARLGTSGSWDASLNLGPVSISASSLSAGNFYPQRLNVFNPAWIKAAGFETLGTWQGTDWQDIRLSGFVESDNPLLNVWDLPGAIQQYGAWVEVNENVVKDALIAVTETPAKMMQIGREAMQLVADNDTFTNDLTNFLDDVNTIQNGAHPVTIPYGATLQDRSSLELELGVEFPIPFFPVIVVEVGAGMEATLARDYDLGKGYWVKGWPYLQTEMPDPPQPEVSFSDVIDALWDKINSGDIYSQLKDLVIAKTQNKFLKYLPFKARNVELLDDEGSSLTLSANSFPAGVDSVFARNWEWDDASRGVAMTEQQRQKARDFHRRLKQERQERAGLQYGIGGFFKFEAEADGWNDDPLLKIAYNDSELAGISENTLGMYWEDENGGWHYLNSTVVPDSNYVRANIPYFCTYTLAPRLPQGEIGLDATPDSLNADGVSTAVINSGILYNNDGTVVANGSLYNVSASRGTIIATDADPESPGIQVAAIGGTISFMVQSDLIPLPIDITASSVSGYSSGQISLDQYSSVPPAAPVLLDASGEHRAIVLAWQPSANPAVVGYKVFYDINSGAPYTGTSNVDGSDSPVTVGMTDHCILTGLSDGQTYYVAVTAINAFGLQSAYSNELSAQPVLRTPLEPTLEVLPTGWLLTWEPVFGAMSYKVFSSDDPSFASPVYLGQTYSLMWADTTETAARRFYRVVAVGY